LDHVAEVKRIMGVKLEASPYAHLVEEYAIGADHVEGTSLSTPHISCTLMERKFVKPYLTLWTRSVPVVGG
jgi:hypothetical protein